METTTDTTKKGKKEPKPIQTTLPTAKNESVFAFLAMLWEDGAPEKLELRACYGEAGMRIGPVVGSEIAFKPNAEPPHHEELIEMTNRLLKMAQEDCDILDRKTNYAVIAYDMTRSDQPIGRKLFKVFPSGTSQELYQMRGGDDSLEGGEGGAGTKLLMKMLDDERRHNRWLMETTLGTVSNILERDGKRMQSLETAIDKSFDQRLKYIAATEAALSQVHERKLREEWQQFQKDAIMQGLQMLGGAVPHIAKAIEKHQEKKKLVNGEQQPAIARGEVDVTPVEPKEAATEPPPATNNPVRTFIESLDNDQATKAFGKYNDKGEKVSEGVFNVEQIELFSEVAGVDDIDKYEDLVKKLFATITPEQKTKAQEIFNFTQLLTLAPLMSKVS